MFVDAQECRYSLVERGGATERLWCAATECRYAGRAWMRWMGIFEITCVITQHEGHKSLGTNTNKIYDFKI